MYLFLVLSIAFLSFYSLLTFLLYFSLSLFHTFMFLFIMMSSYIKVCCPSPLFWTSVLSVMPTYIALYCCLSLFLGQTIENVSTSQLRKKERDKGCVYCHFEMQIKSKLTKSMVLILDGNSEHVAHV